MKIYLAPMEGLADFYLRKLLTESGGFDLAISEFVRVVDRLLPERVFTSQVPELLDNARTPSGTPIRVQLLGNHPEALSENAHRACELGSHGIDLNFGCPSKTVNSSKGGAVLLKEPETLFRVSRQVRQAVDSSLPVSVKMRLGYDDETLFHECVQALVESGANEMTVHARTKSQGYKPPAYWDRPSFIEKTYGIPLIINGEIWTADDATRAMSEANASHIMLGRGAVRNPLLAKQIKEATRSTTSWADIHPKLLQFWTDVTHKMPERYCAGRLKQWLNHLQLAHPEADALFKAIRRTNSVPEISKLLAD